MLRCVVAVLLLAVAVPALGYDHYGRTFVSKYNHRQQPQYRSRMTAAMLLPLENLLTQLAGYTGQTLGKLPQVMNNMKYEMYLGEHSRDPMLQRVLRRYGYTYTGPPLGSNIGVGGSNDILGSLGMGGATVGGTLGKVDDDLFDDFDNTIL